MLCPAAVYAGSDAGPDRADCRGVDPGGDVAGSQAGLIVRSETSGAFGVCRWTVAAVVLSSWWARARHPRLAERAAAGHRLCISLAVALLVTPALAAPPLTAESDLGMVVSSQRLAAEVGAE